VVTAQNISDQNITDVHLKNEITVNETDLVLNCIN
jgi:hypothetical protein